MYCLLGIELRVYTPIIVTHIELPPLSLRLEVKVGVVQCVARPNLEMLLKGPSVIFITSYIFTMLAALKLLKVRDIGWWMAFLSLIIYIIVYSFSGWAIFYPVILSIIGWIYIVMNKKYSTIANHSINTSNEN